MGQIDNDNNINDFVVLGFTKAGQGSVSAWFGCFKDEIAHNPEGIEMYQKEHTDKRPIFVIRDQVERCWSEYNYFWQFYMSKSYGDYLTYRDDNKPFSGTTAIERCNYGKYIKMWKDYNPLVLNIDQVGGLITKFNANTNIPRMEEATRQLTINMLKHAGIYYENLKDMDYTDFI